LDQQSTPATAAALIAHAGPKLILTTSAHRAELAALGGDVQANLLLLDGGRTDPGSWQSLCATAAAPRELPQAEPGWTASLLYTSGTTGTPKAVPLTHANLTANMSALLEARLIDRTDRVLLPLPLHHTYPFTVGLLTVLATGASVILPSGISGPEIGRAARDGGATVLLAVPRLCSALWDSIVATVDARGPFARRMFAALLAVSNAVRRTTGLKLGRWLFGAVHARLGEGLQLIGCGGAKLGVDLARRLEALGWTVLTGYGLTETSPVLTFNRPRHARLDSEGRPLAGVELSVKRERGQRDAEILARGPSVFSGYWDNPGETAAAFTADGWFRTGDLGWLDSRGFLHVVGRSKEVLVLADGKKVFPEHVEKLYAVSPLIREVAVLEEAGSLVALIVPDEHAVRERGALREAALLREELEDVAARLPPYQRIGAYRVTRGPLPRTHLGKLKRHLLPALYRDAARAESAPPAAELAAEDRRLLESERNRPIWSWLAARFPEHELTLDTSPQLDLQIDSLEWVALTIEIEQRFKLALTGEAVSRILTLRDLLRELETAPAAAPAATGAETVTTYVPPGPAMRAVGAVLFVLVRLLMRTAFRLRCRGADRLPSGALLITPNHTSYLDPLAVAAALPWGQLRRTYWAGWVGFLYQGPLKSFLSRAAQVFPVDPDRDLAGAIRTARELLRRGHSVVWFPEGRRSPTGRLESFQSGIGLLLQDGTATAVPAAIRGAFDAWPKHRRWPRPHPVDVAFGEPLAHAPPDLPGEDAERWRVGLEDAVRALLAEPAGTEPATHRRP
jgi:long-chain acyl-CoA synthetase